MKRVPFCANVQDLEDVQKPSLRVFICHLSRDLVVVNVPQRSQTGTAYDDLDPSVRRHPNLFLSRATAAHSPMSEPRNPNRNASSSPSVLQRHSSSESSVPSLSLVQRVDPSLARPQSRRMADSSADVASEALAHALRLSTFCHCLCPCPCLCL